MLRLQSGNLVPKRRNPPEARPDSNNTPPPEGKSGTVPHKRVVPHKRDQRIPIRKGDLKTPAAQKGTGKFAPRPKHKLGTSEARRLKASWKTFESCRQKLRSLVGLSRLAWIPVPDAIARMIYAYLTWSPTSGLKSWRRVRSISKWRVNPALNPALFRILVKQKRIPVAIIWSLAPVLRSVVRSSPQLMRAYCNDHPLFFLEIPLDLEHMLKVGWKDLD